MFWLCHWVESEGGGRGGGAKTWHTSHTDNTMWLPSLTVLGKYNIRFCAQLHFCVNHCVSQVSPILIVTHTLHLPAHSYSLLVFLSIVLYIPLDEVYYQKLPKICTSPPFCTFCCLHTTLRQSGERAFAWILILSCAYAPPAVPHTIVTTVAAFWINGSFNEHVLQEISGACVETKPRGMETTCIISGNGGWPCVRLHFQYKQQKPCRWPASRAIVLLCVRVYMHNRQWS